MGRHHRPTMSLGDRLYFTVASLAIIAALCAFSFGVGYIGMTEFVVR